MIDNEEKATELYHKWFEKHPGVKNPTDINAEIKYRFAMEIGWEDFSLMQRARKQGHDFTKPSTR